MVGTEHPEKNKTHCLSVEFRQTRRPELPYDDYSKRHAQAVEETHSRNTYLGEGNGSKKDINFIIFINFLN